MIDVDVSIAESATRDVYATMPTLWFWLINGRGSDRATCLLCVWWSVVCERSVS